MTLDHYDFLDDVAEHFAEEDNEKSAEEVLLTAIDGLAEDRLTSFALRMTLSGHVGIPREGEMDFLAEAEAAFVAKPTKKKKAPTPIKTAQKKSASKKKLAA